jgi:hypothetical protein
MGGMQNKKTSAPCAAGSTADFLVECANQLIGIYYTLLAPCNSWLMLMQRKSVSG